MKSQVYKIDSNDHTVYKDGLDTYNKIQEWENFENSEFESNENHTRTIEGLKKLEKLKNKNGLNKIWVYSLNEGFYDDENSEKITIRELKTGASKERVYNFMFDYALINLSKDDILWIEYFIQKYRFEKIDDPRTLTPWNVRAMISMSRVGLYLDKHKIDYVKGIWS